MPLDPEHYVIGDDGLAVEKVGPWAKDKLEIVGDYIQISGATRRKYRKNRPAFIDLFCGPGRSVVRSTGEYIDGSPVTAFKQAKHSVERFASIEISDLEPELLAAATRRLQKLEAPVRPTAGPAIAAIATIVSSLNPYGLHFALLDPHNLGALSFSIIEQLAKLQRVDILVHVSVSDLQRNTDLYSSEVQRQFDEFAPEWRKHVSLDANLQSVRASLIEYWSDLLERLGLPRAKHTELIKGPGNQRLYWLMLLSRHPRAHEFWDKVTSPAREPRMF
jgi:three-Cys-motif partner protein